VASARGASKKAGGHWRSMNRSAGEANLN
jgi:hypothetical protein